MALPLSLLNFPITAYQSALVKKRTSNNLTSLNDQSNQHYSKVKIHNLPTADMKIYDITIDPTIEIKGPTEVTGQAQEAIYLVTLLEGEAQVEQDGQSFTLLPGQLGIMISGRSYKITYKSNCRRLSLRMPNKIFCDRILGQTSHKAKAQLLNKSGLLPVVINLIKTLAIDADKTSETEKYTLTNTLIELTAALTRKSLEQKIEQHNPSQEKLIRRLLDYVDANFSDCELTPEKVALANGVSTRYLHRLFQQSGLAVSRFIWERRLKATREDLLDPAKVKLRVSEIAFNRGFNDSAHFSRSFKDKFGLSPTQLRKKAEHAS